MMASKRIIPRVLIAAGVGLVILLLCCYDGPSSARIPSGENVIDDFSTKWERTDVESYYLRSIGASVDPNQRSLMRIKSNDRDDLNNGDSEARTMISAITASNLLDQIWYSNPIRGELGKGINKGLLNVGIFLVGWCAIMCTIGGIMRCYLCCETMWVGRNCNLRSLYYSFADRDSEMAFDNESEGIALDSLGPRDVDNGDE